MTPDAREIAERIAFQIRGNDTLSIRATANIILAALLSHGDAKLEEAAKLAEEMHGRVRGPIAVEIATHIRRLKSTPKPPAPVNPAEQETERE